MKDTLENVLVLGFVLIIYLAGRATGMARAERLIMERELALRELREQKRYDVPLPGLEGEQR